MELKKLSEAQIWLLDYLRERLRRHGSICTVEMEYQFWPDRKWRFDVAVIGPTTRVGIEIEGGAFTQGRHTRGVGFLKDMEKYNHAAVEGWKILRFTPKQVLKGQAKEFLEKYL